MGYREQTVSLRGAFAIDGERYDLDRFGMDDGEPDDPTQAFRFLFQLGSGYMIYLYVIQAGAGGGEHGHFSHSFWLKDCAVAEVEMEEYGPPSQVSAPWCALPLNYVRVTVQGGAAARAFAIASQRFRAPGDGGLEMELALEHGATLRWTRARAWELDEPGAAPRRLGASERLRFHQD
jgi:hypothetical protein